MEPNGVPIISIPKANTGIVAPRETGIPVISSPQRTRTSTGDERVVSFSASSFQAHATKASVSYKPNLLKFCCCLVPPKTAATLIIFMELLWVEPHWMSILWVLFWALTVYCIQRLRFSWMRIAFMVSKVIRMILCAISMAMTFPYIVCSSIYFVLGFYLLYVFRRAHQELKTQELFVMTQLA
eukprot:TRINITY_DN2946_c0_g2_i1.p1 TRINITY_DN2946_c0_g2~~TRINITY_DN2946_c0_g2_i1.p1  ORF type:complete len:183 (+),score=11.71 TRINITY_DN2946_c0_g2_i1:101-649(+)